MRSYNLYFSPFPFHVCCLIYIWRNYFLSPRYRDLWNVLQIVNIGSGVSVLAVYGPNNYRRISGTRLVFMPLSYLIHRNLQLKCCAILIVSVPANLVVLRYEDFSLSYRTDSKTQKLTILKLHFNCVTDIVYILLEYSHSAVCSSVTESWSSGKVKPQNCKNYTWSVSFTRLKLDKI